MTSLVVAPHPDDETLGAGIWMHRHSHVPVYILHVTDGSPKDMQNAHDLGISTREEYAAIRRRELHTALDLIPIPAHNRFRCSFTDKETYRNLTALVAQLDTYVVALKPSLVLTPAYEGGHPDHDAVAFAVAAVHKRNPSFEQWEFPLYHADASGDMICGEFVSPNLSCPEEVSALSAEERLLKHEMLACFETQKEILGRFGVDCERFRRAPVYDFTEAPHPGLLLYERWGWGISGEAWRQRAREAISD